jgi:hypothetical protein
MTIRNCDGTPYKLSGSLNLYDPTSPEHFLLNSFDAEIIQIAGTPILYYEVFIQKQTIDPLFREDRGKLFSTNPVTLNGFYEPIASQNFLNMFGIDAPDEIQFQFNYREVLKAVGHPPKIGSRLYTPHKGENWVIVQRNVGDFFLWGELRLTIIAQRFQESTTTGEGRVSQPVNNVQVNQGSLLGNNITNCK